MKRQSSEPPLNNGLRLAQILCDSNLHGWATLEEDWSKNATGGLANRGGHKLCFYSSFDPVTGLPMGTFPLGGRPIPGGGSGFPEIHLTLAIASTNLMDEFIQLIQHLVLFTPTFPISDSSRSRYEKIVKLFFSIMARANRGVAPGGPPLISYPLSEDEVLASDDAMQALYLALLFLLGATSVPRASIWGASDLFLDEADIYRLLFGAEIKCIYYGPKGLLTNGSVKVGGATVNYAGVGRKDVRLTVTPERCTCKLVGKEGGKLVTYPAIAGLPQWAGGLGDTVKIFPKYSTAKIIGC